MDGGSPPRTRVAVLEDHRLMRQAIAAVLGDAGFALAGEYADVAELAGRLAADAPNVLILGLNAPERAPLLPNSAGVVREVHQRNPEVRVLVFSGAADAELVDRCYREGAAGYLDKRTADGADLAHAVQAVSRGERIVPMQLLRSPFEPSPRRPEPPALQGISIREREVLSYVAAGADNLKIAAMLKISERTVKAHVSSLYKKLGSENRTQLALAALQLGVRPSVEV